MVLTRDFSSGKQFLIWCIKSCKNKNFFKNLRMNHFRLVCMRDTFCIQESAKLETLVSLHNGTKKRTAKRSWLTNVTGSYSLVLPLSSLNITVFCSFTKRSVKRKVKFGENLFKHNYCTLRIRCFLCFPVLSRKFTVISQASCSTGQITPAINLLLPARGLSSRFARKSIRPTAVRRDVSPFASCVFVMICRSEPEKPEYA